ncbi:MAG TPA: thioredoxin family protein [Bacteroidota bacterium]|nr:thioredoxin family protein [Bacteroidota bacterium]
MTPAKHVFPLIAVLSCHSPASAQRIDITVKNLAADKGYISSLNGENALRIDSVTSAGGERFVYNMSAKGLQPGFYRLSFEKNRWIDYVYDNEDVTLTTDAGNILDSMKVVTSESNRLYYTFVTLNKQYKAKSELLQLVLARYPGDDPYYRTTKSTLSKLQSEYSGFVNTTSRARPASFIARYVRAAQSPVVDGRLPPEKQLERLKANGLDHVDFSDEGLIRSDVFTSKSIEYLMYYRNPQLPKELLEKEFMTAVDSILVRARVNQAVYQHVTQYLIEGFRNFGFEKCIDYILANYVIKDDLCLDEGSGSAVAKMVDQKKLFTPGAVLPDILLPDSSGNVIDLKRLPAKRFLVVFYSGACRHCRTLIPKLKEAYDGRTSKETEVLGVSLDTDRDGWLGLVRQERLGWLSVSDLLGWISPVSRNYHIYATPTMVVVDNEMRMIAAPATVEEARKWF